MLLGAGTVYASRNGQEPSYDELHLALSQLSEEIDDIGERFGISACRIGVDVGDRQEDIIPWLKTRGKEWVAIKGAGGHQVKMDRYAIINKSRRLKPKAYRDVDNIVAVRWQTDRWWLFLVHDHAINRIFIVDFLLQTDAPGAYLLPVASKKTVPLSSICVQPC